MARLTLLALSIILLAGCGSEPAELAGIGPAGAMRFLSGDDGADYARVLTSRPFEFPQDHASHPEFRSEWWYFTGNLAGSDGRRFGFELTFFRFALAPEQPERKSKQIDEMENQLKKSQYLWTFTFSGTQNHVPLQ